MKHKYAFNPFKRGDIIRTVPFLDSGETEFVVFDVFESGLSAKSKNCASMVFVFWDEVLGPSKESSFSDDEWE